MTTNDKSAEEEVVEISDTELIKQVLDGDTAAYDQLVRKYQGKIYGLVYNMTSNKHDAEDMVQDIFVKAYQALPRFKGNSSFYTWLYRISINRTINFVKKRKKKAALSLDDIDMGLERDEAYVELSSQDTPFRGTQLNELQIKLNEAVQTLSEKHRTVVVLHDIQGVPHDEIAEMLEISSGTVRSRLFYARKLLQAELTEYLS